MGERASREAAAWAAKLNGRAVDTLLLAEFYQWHRDPENAAAYAQIESVWRQAGNLGDDRDIAMAVHAALDRPTPRMRLARWLTWSTRPVLAVAMAVLVAGLAGVLLLARPDSYQTGVGEQRLLRLADGSRVRINTDSLLRVRLKDNQRIVELVKGEAYFEVAHDPSRPFTVQAAATEVVAVGTRFDVQHAASGVHVILAQGLVDVRSSNDQPAVRLRPGQAVWMDRSRRSDVETVDSDALTSWTTGQLTFHDTPLRDAVAEVNRYTSRGIDLDIDNIGDARVTGVFETGDIPAFVAATTTLFGLRTVAGPSGRTVLTNRREL